MGDIWFCGDNHGEFAHIIAAVKRHRPSAIVLVGDVQAKNPLHIEIAEILDVTAVYWIPGNHDTDSEQNYDNLFGSDLADRNLHGRVVNIEGVRIAGLGGIFREKVWLPPGEPIYNSAKDYLRVAGKGNRWRGGLPLRHRSTIFYDDYLRLSRLSADVLVTHEAPGAHPQGKEALELLAITMSATKLYHGHTHDSLPYYNQQIQLCGVGLCGITSLDGEKIIPGALDEARSDRKSFK